VREMGAEMRGGLLTPPLSSLRGKSRAKIVGEMGVEDWAP